MSVSGGVKTLIHVHLKLDLRLNLKILRRSTIKCVMDSTVHCYVWKPIAFVRSHICTHSLTIDNRVHCSMYFTRGMVEGVVHNNNPQTTQTGINADMG